MVTEPPPAMNGSRPPVRPAKAITGEQTRAARQGGLDHEVDQPGREARAEPGQGELQLDALRRRDGAGVLILHRAVNLEAFRGGAVNLATFEARQGTGWRRLERLAGPRRRAPRAPRPGRRAASSGALYRQAAADLAYARRRFPGDPVVGAARGARHARARRRLRAGRAGAAACAPSCRAATGGGWPSGPAALARRLAAAAAARGWRPALWSAQRPRGGARARAAGAAGGGRPARLEGATSAPPRARRSRPRC